MLRNFLIQLQGTSPRGCTRKSLSYPLMSHPPSVLLHSFSQRGFSESAGLPRQCSTQMTQHQSDWCLAKRCMKFLPPTWTMEPHNSTKHIILDGSKKQKVSEEGSFATLSFLPLTPILFTFPNMSAHSHWYLHFSQFSMWSRVWLFHFFQGLSSTFTGLWCSM